MFVLRSERIRVGNIAWRLNGYPHCADGVNFIFELFYGFSKKTTSCFIDFNA